MDNDPVSANSSTSNRNDRFTGSPGSGAEVPSPCVNICVLDASAEFCTGCYRSLDEIADWGTLDADARRLIVKACEVRMSAAFENRDS